MAKSYLPLFRPGDTVTFSAAAAVSAGQLVEVGTVDMSVVPAVAASAKYVGVAGHDAAAGDKTTIEIGKPIHELKAVGAITRGSKLEAAAAGGVRTLAAGDAIFLALTSAADGTVVRAIQL
ncbi:MULTISPECIES: capsid cement protein [Mycetocola]|uniref:capsid cement protein n=1 Tax=Mycetocola TaxID=76634 RepID=UPI0004C0203A|nr:MULTISPECIES: capsid cement protein [Mycetocola]